MGRNVFFFFKVRLAIPLPTTASPTLQDALKDGFGEAVVACDSCQKKFLWTHKGVDLAPHPVVGLVLQVGAQMLRSFPRLSVSKVWILFSASKQGPCFTAIEEDGGDKSLVKLELNCKADGVARQILFNLPFLLWLRQS